jgi:ligand-binding sensor domain-containing protein/signal transduction histidine kinase
MKSLFVFLFFVFASITFTNVGLAQQIQKRIKFQHIEANSQLSNLNITSICQDSKGLLWVGTEDGLNRFDGYDIKIYRTLENDTASLFKNIVKSIFEDSRGILWVSTLNSGLHYYDRAADVFHRIPAFSYKHCQVLSIIEDFNHNIWIGGLLNSEAFVAMLDHQTGKWNQFRLFPASKGITSMLQNSEDEFWLGSRLDGLFKWNKKTNVLERYLHDANNSNSLPGNYIEKLAKDSHGNLWIGTRDAGLCKFNIKKNIYKNYETIPSEAETTIPSNTVLDLCLDGNNLWIATENGGLSKINTETEALTNYFYNKADPNTIINNSISALGKDRQGRIWIGSYAKGLCVFDALDEKFQALDITLENDLVNAIIKDSKDRMWIGTEAGLVLRDENGTHYFKNDSKNINSLGSNAVTCIYEDHKHRIWVGLWNGGINRFVENTRSFVRYESDPNRKGSLTNPYVFSLTQYSKTGELLVSTLGGLNILKDEKAGIFENKFEYLREADKNHITLFEDSKQNIWVGAFSGLSLYSLESKTIQQLNILNDTTNVNDHVNSIFEDHNGVLWIGSNKGLHQMISPTKFITYTIKDGLPVNIIQAIVEDSKGNLWLGTTKGLTVFDPVTKAFKTYGKSDGLLSNEIRRNSFFKAKNGQLYVGVTGINTFFPDSVISNPNKPLIYITDLKIFNQSIKPKGNDGILKDDIAETKEIYLNHTQTFFSLHYVGINFTDSYKNQYAYKLDGFDTDWVNVGTQRFATFTNLDPGTYIFQVKASNNDGLWNEEGTSLIIHILPPWWATWWFKIFGVLFIGASGYAFYRHRIRVIAKSNKKLSALVKERTKELRETNKALIKSEDEIAAQNEELIQSQEEISAQRDLVFRQNENLEEEVSRRTQELVEYNQQLEQFAFISAHNLRAPVARILGLGHLLGIETDERYKKEQIYPKLIRSTQELDEVVRDLNRILEIRKNNSSFIESINLAAVVLMVQKNLEQEINLTRASITTDFASIESISAVKAYLDSILYNLISNAIKYRDPFRVPIIHIKTEKIENEICLSVSDNGLGIDVEAFREKLFTLYSRFHSHIEGKGMGLYLVKTQTIAMGGRIEVDSEVDKGTIFKLYFNL